MSDVLRDELLRQGKEPTKKNMALLGDEWRKIYGMDIVMRKTLERAEKYERTVITGIRSIEEVEYIRHNAKSFCLVAIVADAEVRFSRRNELDPQTREEFFARDEIDIKNKGLGKVISAAEFCLVNNYSTKEEFHAEIDKLMTKIGISPTNLEQS